MRKLIMLIPMLLAANSALAETDLSGVEAIKIAASEVVTKGTVIAVEKINGNEWHLLVAYRGMIFNCETISGGMFCTPLY
jgi:hypothetical protein